MKEQDEENTEKRSEKGPPDQDDMTITPFTVRRMLQPSHAEPPEGDLFLEQLHLRSLTYLCLNRRDIRLVSQLLQLHCTDVLSFRHFGQAELEDLQSKLQAAGYAPLLP